MGVGGLSPDFPSFVPPSLPLFLPPLLGKKKGGMCQIIHVCHFPMALAKVWNWRKFKTFKYKGNEMCVCV